MATQMFYESGVNNSSTLTLEDVVMSLQLMGKRITELETKIEGLERRAKECELAGLTERDRLSCYFLDDRIYYKVVAACRHCESAKDIVYIIYPLLRQLPFYDIKAHLNPTFVSALRPHLVKIKKEKSDIILYKEIAKIYPWLD